jgi:hypothetical protein
VTVHERGRRLWTGQSNQEFAIVLPRQGEVVYFPCGDKEPGTLRLLARDFDGKPRWKTTLDFMTPIVDIQGGGDIALFSEFPGVAGVQVDDVRQWDGIWGDAPVLAFDVRRRRVLWRSDYRRVGDTVWTNGTVFVSVRLDLTRSVLRRAADGRGKIPVCLEQRRVRDRRLLWRRRLPGYPPGLTQALRGRGGTVRLVFDDRERVPYGYRSFPRFLDYLRRFEALVPLRGGALSAAGDATVIFRAQ